MNRLSMSITAVLPLAIGLISTSLAQVSIGLHGGINVANATIDPNAFGTVSSHTGFMIGAVAEVGILGPLSVQVEPTYCQRGAALSSVLTVDIDHHSGTTAKFNYLEIPLLLKFNLLSEEVKPYIFTGPNLGIRLTSTFDTQVGGKTFSQDMQDQTEALDFAWDFGAGVACEVTPLISITIDARYSHGLTDVANSPTLSWHSRDFKIMAGVLFTP